ncbi:Cyclic diguanosine monophosphate-binding protein [compost metagenome]
MDVQLTHQDNGQLGFECRHISLESIERLRRLIELNLGDQAELERELGALIEV